jgi:hypothetical protein
MNAPTAIPSPENAAVASVARNAPPKRPRRYWSCPTGVAWMISRIRKSSSRSTALAAKMPAARRVRSDISPNPSITRYGELTATLSGPNRVTLRANPRRKKSSEAARKGICRE